MSTTRNTSFQPAQTMTAASGAGTRKTPGGVLSEGRWGSGGGAQRPRSRSRGLIVLAALLVLGFGLAVAAWGLRVGDKAPVVSVAAPVAKGETVTRESLTSSSVAGVTNAIPVSELEQLVGQTAATDLFAGQILTSDMTTTDPVPAEGEATVGLALEPTRVPSTGLDPGDVVDVVAVPGGQNGGGKKALDAPTQLADDAEVLSVTGTETAGGQVLVTVIVEESDATRVAAYMSQNQVAIVETAPNGGSS